MRSDLDIRARYSQGGGIYRIIPAAVARPASPAELHAAITHARERGLGVTIRGAGSAMDGSNVGSGIVIDMTGYDLDNCQVDGGPRTVRASPAYSLGEIGRRARPAGLRLPVDPSSSEWATLGGTVSTNAAGPRTVQAGSIRPWVVGLALDTTDGHLGLDRGREQRPSHPAVMRWKNGVEPLLRRHEAAIRAVFPKVRKNSAGYALDRFLDSGELIDIVIGSEGTLGVITEITLRLQAAPMHRASLRVAVRSRGDLLGIIESIRVHDPSTLELLDGSFLRLVAGQPGIPERPDLLYQSAAIILADFEGDDAGEVFDRAARAAGSVEAVALDVRLSRDAAGIESIWRIRHGASPILAGLADGRRSLQVVEDGCVPVHRLAEYLDAVDRAASAQRIDAVMFGHAGDGHVHVNLLPNVRDPDWKDRVRAVFDSVTEAVIRLGGTPSGEHGAGRLRAGTLEQLYGSEVMECFRAVKHAFDPEGIFNPGVIIGDGSDPLSRLKVGADAPPLPPGVEEYLQRIEADTRWGESRWMPE